MPPIAAAAAVDERTTHMGRCPSVASSRPDARLRSVLREHADYTARTLRRFGVTGAAAEDAAQQIAIVMARRLAEVPEGGERQFLFGVARRVAWSAHRQAMRHGENLGEELVDAVDATPNPEQVLELERARVLVVETLQRMPAELRAVFVLHEIEEMSMAHIAARLDVPPGTVASRLRRARAHFGSVAAQFRNE